MLLGILYSGLSVWIILAAFKTLEKGLILVVLAIGLMGHIVLDKLFWKYNAKGIEFCK